MFSEALIEITFVSTTSSISFPSISTKLYSTSISKVGSRWYKMKNSESFVELCLLILCPNKDPFQKPSLMSLWWSYSVVQKAYNTSKLRGWYVTLYRVRHNLTQPRPCRVKFCNFINKLPPLLDSPPTIYLNSLYITKILSSKD